MELTPFPWRPTSSQLQPALCSRYGLYLRLAFHYEQRLHAGPQPISTRCSSGHIGSASRPISRMLLRVTLNRVIVRAEGLAFQ